MNFPRRNTIVQVVCALAELALLAFSTSGFMPLVSLIVTGFFIAIFPLLDAWGEEVPVGRIVDKKIALTQAEYDSITNKDRNTVYLIT